MIGSLPSDLVGSIEDVLSTRTGARVTIRAFVPAAGGCVNNGGQITTSLGDYFIKWNNASAYPAMFDAEAAGLRLLQGAGTMRVPQVIAYGESGRLQYLILEFIGAGTRNELFWRSLGRGLAMLHQQSASHFGLPHDNFIGSLVQVNKQTNSWTDFFVTQRIETQLDLAEGKIGVPIRRKFDLLFRQLSSMIPEVQPSLLHGDLWGGNVIADSDGIPCLIDPAVYYGHREVDLAMTKLFGGFAPAFYDEYNNRWPLDEGHEERMVIYNLYPLLVHVNLFGGHYIADVENSLNSIL